MPRRHPKGYYSRKSRAQRARRRKSTITRTLAPRTRRFKLRYVNSVTLDPPVAGVTANYYFSANGMFDPNITGVGHQPLGFDQYMAMYDHYVVTKSKCTVYNQNNSSDPICLGIFLNDDTANLHNTVEQINEQPNTKWRYLSADGNGASAGTVTKYFNTAKDLGRKSVLSDPQLKGSAAANPTEQMFYQIYLGTLDPAMDHPGTVVQVIIEYEGYFIEPKDLAQS